MGAAAENGMKSMSKLNCSTCECMGDEEPTEIVVTGLSERGIRRDSRHTVE